MAVGMGMKVVASDPFISEVTLNLQLAQTGQEIPVLINTITVDELLAQSDFISLHVPGKIDGKSVIGTEEFKKMKNGVGLVNAARGGVIDEDALLQALDQGKLAFCGLDVFENEPTPRTDLLKHPKISVTPHIGASTAEAQERIAAELAGFIIRFYGK
jgi:D-3-phosphoglycerate dehydrogenase